MKNKINISPPKGSPLKTEFDTSAKKTNGPTDLFSLLYVPDGKQDCSTVPPRWATFDCKTTMLRLHMLFSNYLIGYIGTLRNF